MTDTKVLIVEDEVVLGQIIKDTLEIRNFQVLHITDGKLAYEVYLKEKPQIIVLDVMLPSVNGFDIARTIRIHNKHIPILFLTARSTTQDLSLGFKAGGNDYLKKPFDLEELIIRMGALLNRNRSLEEPLFPEAGQVIIGLFQYDTLRNTLLIQNKSIQLSARENEVLLTLFQHKAQLLTRKALLMKVWGNDDFFSSRSLDVYISKLRRRLSLDPSVKIINHRGFGYKLIC